MAFDRLVGRHEHFHNRLSLPAAGSVRMGIFDSRSIRYPQAIYLSNTVIYLSRLVRLCSGGISVFRESFSFTCGLSRLPFSAVVKVKFIDFRFGNCLSIFWGSGSWNFADLFFSWDLRCEQCFFRPIESQRFAVN